jgi:hypothetical protein
MAGTARAGRRQLSSDRALRYGLAKGLSPEAQLRAVVTDLSGGGVRT